MSSDSSTSSWLGIDRRILALGGARMADAMGNSFLVIVLPLYVASEAVTGRLFGVPSSLVAGVVLALFGIASSVAQPMAGRISDRMGQRKVFVLWGLLVFSVSIWHLGGSHSTGSCSFFGSCRAERLPSPSPPVSPWLTKGVTPAVGVGTWASTTHSGSWALARGHCWRAYWLRWGRFNCRGPSR